MTQEVFTYTELLEVLEGYAEKVKARKSYTRYESDIHFYYPRHYLYTPRITPREMATLDRLCKRITREHNVWSDNDLLRSQTRRT